MINKKTIIDFMQQGKKYEYIGENFASFKNKRIYRCSLHLPFMIIMSYKNRRMKLRLGNIFNYPVNNVKNWKDLP